MSYHVEAYGNCILVFGDVPPHDLAALCELVPFTSVMDACVARVTQATYAMGPDVELRELAQKYIPAALDRVRERYPGLSSHALQWLAGGERGTSSNTIFSWLTGVDVMDGASFDVPRDLGEWRSCQLLIEQVPELAEQFDVMQLTSPNWQGLVEKWIDIATAMTADCPSWRDPSRSCHSQKAQRLLNMAVGIEAAYG